MVSQLGLSLLLSFSLGSSIEVLRYETFTLPPTQNSTRLQQLGGFLAVLLLQEGYRLHAVPDAHATKILTLQLKKNTLQITSEGKTKEIATRSLDLSARPTLEIEARQQSVSALREVSPRKSMAPKKENSAPKKPRVLAFSFAAASTTEAGLRRAAALSMHLLREGYALQQAQPNTELSLCLSGDGRSVGVGLQLDFQNCSGANRALRQGISQSEAEFHDDLLTVLRAELGPRRPRPIPKPRRPRPRPDPPPPRWLSAELLGTLSWRGVLEPGLAIALQADLLGPLGLRLDASWLPSQGDDLQVNGLGLRAGPSLQTQLGAHFIAQGALQAGIWYHRYQFASQEPGARNSLYLALPLAIGWQSERGLAILLGAEVGYLRRQLTHQLDGQTIWARSPVVAQGRLALRWRFEL